MNERVMQFRIGMFVIVAGLVLTMLIVWFGESPSLLRDQVYLKARYADAPGVLEGVAVRKSGIRVGEVVAIAVRPSAQPARRRARDHGHRAQVPDPRGVRATALSRSLIGDVTIDLLPGTGQANLQLGRTAADAPIIEGEVAADPSKALAAATQAFEKAGDTLKSDQRGSHRPGQALQERRPLDDFLKTWTKTGQDVSAASQGIDQFLKTNEADFRTTMANLQKVADKLNNTLTPETQDSLKTGIARLSSAIGPARRRSSPTSDPLLKDLGSPVNHTPTTDFGQSVRRFNRVAPTWSCSPPPSQPQGHAEHRRLDPEAADPAAISTTTSTPWP